MRIPSLGLTGLFLAASVFSACEPRDLPARDSGILGGSDGSLLHEILKVQDARDISRSGIATLTRGLSARAPGIRVMAARAIGRMETPSLVALLEPALGDPHAGVRGEAANAVAQAAFQGGAEVAMEALLPRLESESDPGVRGLLAQSLGRLPFESAEQVDRVEAMLARTLGARTVETVEGYGFARSMAGLAIRRQALGLELSPFLMSRLDGPARQREERVGEGEFEPGGADFVRRAAMDGLLRARGTTLSLLRVVMSAPDPELRRMAAAGAARLVGVAMEEVLEDLLSDPHPQVRYEALRAYGVAGPGASLGCGPFRNALSDVSVHVRVLAASAPGGALACVGAQNGPTREDLVSRAGSLTGGGGAAEWSEAVAALGTLARVWPGEARIVLEVAMVHPLWQVRMASAPIAALLLEIESLRGLSQDRDANVQEAALRGLSALVGHEADEEYRRALAAEDPQLVMTAARLLAGTPEPDAALEPILVALERFTRFGGETSRDARLALLERAEEVGTPSQASALEPLVGDFDPVVASAAAEILSEWTGHEVAAHPRTPSRPGSVPSPGVLADYALSRVIFEMEGGGRFVVVPAPFLAPTNVHRLMTMALSGFADGLTLHRIAPNFVVQGLSPGANEYWGHGGFTRDELGIPSNLRGTMGLSTRGRDSGDGQIYVNLVDNLRLDHNYTVFGTVVEGMDILDGMTAGAVVARITVEGPAAQ